MVQVPYTPLPQVATPAGPSRQVWQRGDFVNTDTFGGNVGTALSGLGRQIEVGADVAAKHALAFQTDMIQKDTFNKTADLIKAESEEETRLAEAQRAASATDGKGFVESYMKDAKKRLDAIGAAVHPTVREQFNVNRQRLEEGLRQKAFAAQIKLSDGYHLNQVKTTFDVLQKRIQDNPDQTDALREEGYKLIDTTALTPETKQQLKEAWKSGSAATYIQAWIKKDPAVAAEKLGGATNAGRVFDRGVLGVEGGVDPTTGRGLTSPKGALGLGQIMPETARMVARELGIPGLDDMSNAELASVLKSDHKLNYRLSRRYYDSTLERTNGSIPAALAGYQAGRENGVKWHKEAVKQFGENYTAEQFISVIPAGITDGNLTTREYVARALQKAGVNVASPAISPVSTGDPRLADLTYEMRNSLRDAADRAVKQQRLDWEQFQVRQSAEQLNQIQIGVRDGLLGRADIDNAIKAGSVPKYEDQQKLYSILEAREKKLSEVSTGMSMIGLGSANRYDKDHRDKIDVAFESMTHGDQSPVSRMEKGALVWQQTKILPKIAAQDLLASLASPNAQTLVRAMQLIDQINSSFDTDPFGSVGSGKDRLEAAAAFYRKEALLGGSAQSIAARWIEQEDPSFKAKTKVRDDELKKFKDDLAKNDQGKILQKLVGPGGIAGVLGIGRPEYLNGATKDAMVSEFIEHASRYYMEHKADKDAAFEYAKAQVTKSWGVTYDKKIMKYPPDLAYGQDWNGSTEWIYKYAADEIGRMTNDVPPPHNKVRIVELPRSTEDAYNAGPDRRTLRLRDGQIIGGVPYMLVYTDKNGIEQTLFRPGTKEPLAWVPDLLRKQREDEFFRKRKIETIQKFAPGAAPPDESMGVSPVPQPLSGFDPRTGLPLQGGVQPEPPAPSEPSTILPAIGSGVKRVLNLPKKLLGE